MYNVPKNHAVQVFDTETKKSRVCIGPDIVMLEPTEEFNVIKAKDNGSIKKVKSRDTENHCGKVDLAGSQINFSTMIFSITHQYKELVQR